MKDIAKIVMFSMLGGAITLGSYKAFFEAPQTQQTQITAPITNNNALPSTIPVNNNAKLNALAANNVDLTTAVEKTVDAVVHVTNTSTYVQPRSLRDYFFNRGEQMQKGSTGSGVIISEDGYIVTNNHVIADAETLTVTLNDQKKYEAKVIGIDKKHDIALIKIDADTKLKHIPFGNSDNTKIGEWVLAVGNPYNLTSTVTAGIVSAKSRDLDGDTNVQSFIQTDAAVNPGNSGGALVNTRGELIGINTAISSSTGSYVGYAFAVPSNITKKIVEDLLEYGNVQQGILGVSGVGLDNSIANRLELKETEGYYIAGVDPKSGAHKAGLKEGDIIKKIDNIKIAKSSDLIGYLSSKRPGNTVQVTILRKGNTKTLPVKLSNKNILVTEAFGLQLKNLSDSSKASRGLSAGVLVTQNNSKFLAQKLRITKNCVITQINETAIDSIDDLAQLESLNIKNLYNIEVIYPSGKVKNWWLR